VTEHPNEGVPRHPGGDRGLEGGYPSGLGPPPHMPPQWPPQRPLPPREVGIAFKLWVAQIIFGLLSTVVLFAFSDPFAAGRQRVAANRAQGGGLSPQQFDTFLMTILIIGGVFGVLFLAVEVWLLLKMRRGRNWARITLTVLAGISVLGTLITAPRRHHHGNHAGYRAYRIADQHRRDRVHVPPRRQRLLRRSQLDLTDPHGFSDRLAAAAQ